MRCSLGLMVVCSSREIAWTSCMEVKPLRKSEELEKRERIDSPDLELSRKVASSRVEK